MAKGILVDSYLGKTHVHESYRTSLNKIFVLPYVPGACFSENAGLNRDTSMSSELPEKFVFYPAQFWEHKNHKRLIEAVALVMRKLPDIRLLLAGSKKNGYLQVVEQVKRLGLLDRVRFLGYVPDSDIPGIYRRARALVFPTFFGPTNIPPLEAFALGCPVAASNIYAMPEQLGDAALYFDPHSVEQIADCISRLWSDDDLCARLSGNGRLLSKRWNAEKFQFALHAIIRQLTNGVPTAPESEFPLDQGMSAASTRKDQI
jgi:glycosyltransferase involved in cell wall biosynthesis